MRFNPLKVAVGAFTAADATSDAVFGCGGTASDLIAAQVMALGGLLATIERAYGRPQGSLKAEAVELLEQAYTHSVQSNDRVVAEDPGIAERAQNPNDHYHRFEDPEDTATTFSAAPLWDLEEVAA